MVDENGRLTNIVEQRDIDKFGLQDADRCKLINTGVYAFDADSLFESIGYVCLMDRDSCDELYLTDVPQIIQSLHASVEVEPIRLYRSSTSYDETMGANTVEQLQAVRLEYLTKFEIKNVATCDLTDSFISEYVTCLSELTTVDVTEADYHRIRLILSNSLKGKTNYVVLYESRVIGVFSILIEQKIIHRMGCVARLEDVVVLAEFRHIGIGSMIVRFVKDACAGLVYKILLDCTDDKTGFYEKSGFKRASNSMRFDL
jgi:bifunctional N-acetylglucosamine-1-phosphate-uridyltransferase/glucosamine-1-phosphate-acetyltransferase GlmU-like protein